MNSEEDRPVAKISYEKPTAVDLGPTAPMVGQSCVDGPDIQSAICERTGNGAFDTCESYGNSAADLCTDNGSLPGGSCDGLGSGYVNS